MPPQQESGLKKLLVVFSHGKESGPLGNKIQSLMAIAKQHGAQVMSVDYREHPAGTLHDQNQPGEADRRVAQMLATPLPEHELLVLVGSSMGGYVSTVASQQLKPQGLFLMAPAFYMPGYTQQDLVPDARLICVVHGWRDDVVPPANSIRFAETHHGDLHLLVGDHRLNTAMPKIEPIFERFLQQIARTPQQTASRAWVRQPSGRHLDLVNPDPNQFDDSDLALGLARTFRWGGHSVWPRPLTVAQHSLTVLHLRRQSGVLSPRVQLLELLHDAEEGLVGFDPISPLKPILGYGFQSVMERLQRTVLDRYRVGDWTDAEYKEHKLADVLAAASEAVHVAGWSHAEVRNVLGIQVKPLDHDPLVAIYGGQPWEPWPVEVAAKRLLDMLHNLSSQVVETKDL